MEGKFDDAEENGEIRSKILERTSGNGAQCTYGGFGFRKEHRKFTQEERQITREQIQVGSKQWWEFWKFSPDYFCFLIEINSNSSAEREEGGRKTWGFVGRKENMKQLCERLGE